MDRIDEKGYFFLDVVVGAVLILGLTAAVAVLKINAQSNVELQQRYQAERLIKERLDYSAMENMTDSQQLVKIHGVTYQLETVVVDTGTDGRYLIQVTAHWDSNGHQAESSMTRVVSAGDIYG